MKEIYSIALPEGRYILILGVRMLLQDKSWIIIAG
ncbi:hypothetical protein ECH_0314 [Ehrlichia chaffeensis str. Arkansas]|uniref:Uncharacterized protein n=1 Tax=Ehrlichia chaffeensis (strain ATCC CRL-10679 / Arkansas) TaxID=205920 RepID=Q2GHE8_EHRCR|nr:hypothetical protein ECH_0314 [Ehrlichia chaffeensis str. Arkansas]